jgi:hypothetical protein
LQFISFEDENDFDAACIKLSEAVRTDLTWLRKHTELGDSARIWESEGRHRGFLIRTPALQAAERWRTARPNGAPKLTVSQNEYIDASRKGLRQRVTLRVAASLAAALATVFLLSNIGVFLYILNVDHRRALLQAMSQTIINFSGKEERLPKITALISELEEDYAHHPNSSDISLKL